MPTKHTITNEHTHTCAHTCAHTRTHTHTHTRAHNQNCAILGVFGRENAPAHSVLHVNLGSLCTYVYTHTHTRAHNQNCAILGFFARENAPAHSVLHVNLGSPCTHRHACNTLCAGHIFTDKFIATQCVGTDILARMWSMQQQTSTVRTTHRKTYV